MNDEMGPIDILKTLGDGRVMDDLYEQLGNLLMAVQMSHKKGKVVLTIEVAPTKDVEVPRVDVWGDVSARIPHIERSSEMFYVTDRNQLSRRNPRQPALPPNTVRMPPREELVDVDDKSLAAGEKA